VAHPLVLFAFFFKTKERGKEKTPEPWCPFFPFTATSCILIHTSLPFAILLCTKKEKCKTKQILWIFICFILFFWRNKVLAMWINSHQVAYFEGISTTFPTLLEMPAQSNLSLTSLEMLTQSNLSLLYVRYSHLIKTSACTRHTEQKRRKKKSLSRKHLPWP